MSETLLNTKQIYASQPLYKAYTIVGNDITISNDNIASGFSSYGTDDARNSNLLLNKQFPSSFSLLEIDAEFTCGNFNQDKGFPLFACNNAYKDIHIAGNSQDDTAYHLARYDGYNFQTGSTNLSKNETYALKYIMNYANSVEEAYILVGGTWVQQFSVNPSGTWLENKRFCIGGSHKYDNAFVTGSINLNKTAIYIDGECFFNGVKNWVPSTSALTAVTGFDASKQQTLQNDNGTLKWVDNA